MSLEKSYKKGLFLEYFTVGYNVVEAVVSIVFGHMANSIALIGFGLDSVVESLSGLVLIWRLRQHGKISAEKEETVEKKATRFVALTFLILGLYVLFQSVKKLIAKENLSSVALPRLATGVGGLDWSDVKPLIDNQLADVAAEIYVYHRYIPGKKADEPRG